MTADVGTGRPGDTASLHTAARVGAFDVRDMM